MTPLTCLIRIDFIVAAQHFKGVPQGNGRIQGEYLDVDVYVAGSTKRRNLALSSERHLLRFRVSLKIMGCLTTFEGLLDERDSDCHRRNEQ